ncbi:FAD-binding protein [Dysosmobacter sp.]|uniref:FAD-binding protein n=1 Tax=Dysosmobacter sp. TaxID=2591382 RepID=UPI002A89115C|nr:FAD-binding protein [Dysosmobacter sp.]MDY3282520.1 FAD-binding protein [Dysosmobacter sp.]
MNKTVDVLVIGGSGAGISAAIAAVEQKQSVLLISKGKLGKNGNAIMAGGSFSIDGKSARAFGYEKADERVTQDVVFDNLVKEGYYLNNQKLVRQFVEESPQVVYDLVKFGEKAGQTFAFLPPGKWFSVGRSWAAALKESVKAHPDIQILEDCTVIDLIRTDGRVTGAIGYDIYTGERICVHAKAVILATGGYQPFSLKNTVTDMTGDGLGMAYRAGAGLADMEFVLCFPTALSPKAVKGSIYPYLIQVLMGKWGMPPVVRNAKGEEIVLPPEVYELVRGSKMEKLTSCYYWGQEIFRGNGTPNGGVYFDYSGYPAEKRAEILDRYINYMATWHRKGYYMGDDISALYQRIRDHGLLEVGLGCEYSNGGVLVDETMATEIPGLYAAGEVTSGVFGAMRAGDGLVEMLVQGHRAGLSAADYARNCDGAAEARTPDFGVLEQALARKKDGISPIRAMRQMEKIADYGFNFVRSGDRMEKSLQDLDRFGREVLPNLAVSNPNPVYNLELLSLFAVQNLFLCLKAGLTAAELRRESRGSHIRVDCPEVNHDEYLHRTVFHRDGGAFRIDFRRPEVVKFQLPQGKDRDIISYLFNEEHQYLRPKMR